MNLESVIEQAYDVSERLIADQCRFNYPFRNRYRHTLRVLNWARRIHAVEGGDIDIITLAVLFHDTGWSDTRDHAILGAELAEKYLENMGLAPSLISRISSAVQTHNKRDRIMDGLPIENMVIMDADILDEVGVTTLVWDSMATAHEKDSSYAQVLERNHNFFRGSVERMDELKTVAGKKFYQERIEMWEKCLSHFRYELGLKDHFPA